MFVSFCFHLFTTKNVILSGHCLFCIFMLLFIYDLCQNACNRSMLDQINPGKSKAIRFTRAGVKNPLGYSLGDQKIPEATSFKYLGIILQSNLNWVEQVNYVGQKAWKALHFVMHVLKKVNRKTKF